MNTTFLELINIIKDFPGVRALNNVNLKINTGEVHVLLGENGAGKSTLMKILSGVYLPTSGKILMDEKDIKINNPRFAREIGISPIFQEMNIVPYLSVGENIFLGREPKNRLGVDFNEINKSTIRVLKRLGMGIKPNILVKDLGIAQKQMIEIARAILTKSRLVIMDEPTSALGEIETKKLFEIIRSLKKEGIAILYISHRLEEIFEIGDKVTVLRDGKLVDTVNIKEVTKSKIITMMVGRTINEIFPRNFMTSGEKVLQLKNVSSRNKLRNINLKVCKGEIVGLYGLVGAGRTELAQILFGLDSFNDGYIEIFGKHIEKLNPIKCIKIGLGLLPEDRHKNGLCLGLSVKSNITKSSLEMEFPSGFISPIKEAILANRYIQECNIITPSVNRIVEYLSGGNQQKTMIAQWRCAQSNLLIFDEPTRGIDVGAKVEVHQFMNAHVNKGNSILMISSELPEILGMSDRIYIMYRGQIVKEFIRGEANQESIIQFAIMGSEKYE